MKPFRRLIPAACALLAGGAIAADTASCKAESGTTLTPVIELYTSEGCSSCPPADKWLSTLKPLAARGQAVVQAFHVGYWDYIGWVDRFAAPSHTTRQREVAKFNRLNNIYTPQLVRSGRDAGITVWSTTAWLVPLLFVIVVFLWARRRTELRASRG